MQQREQKKPDEQISFMVVLLSGQKIFVTANHYDLNSDIGAGWIRFYRESRKTVFASQMGNKPVSPMMTIDPALVITVIQDGATITLPKTLKAAQ